MRGQLHNGESIIKEWAYSDLDTLIVTNQRLIHEYRIGEDYVHKTEIKLTKYSRIESSIFYGRVNIPLLLYGILTTISAIASAIIGTKAAIEYRGDSFFSSAGILGTFIGIGMIVAAILAKNRTAIKLKVFKQVDTFEHPLFGAMSFGMSQLSGLTLKFHKANRQESSDLFEKIGSILLVKKEEKEETEA